MDQALQKRLNGILPIITIVDDEYIVDWRLKELRMKDHPENIISLQNMDTDAEGRNYLCFYNTKKKSVIRIGDDITELPKNVVMLKIPYELKLDPVGVAREYGLGDTELLNKYPIQESLQAEQVSLKDTMLPKIIEANRKRQNLLQKPETKKRKHRLR